MRPPSYGPSRSGCSRQTRHGAPPSTTCSLQCWDRAARLRAPARAQHVALHRMSSAARCERRRASRASPTSWASPRGQNPAASLARFAKLHAPVPRAHRAPDPDQRAARPGDRDHRHAPDADAIRGTPSWPSRPVPLRRAAQPPRRCGRKESAAIRPRSMRAVHPALAFEKRIRLQCRSG